LVSPISELPSLVLPLVLKYDRLILCRSGVYFSSSLFYISVAHYDHVAMPYPKFKLVCISFCAKSLLSVVQRYTNTFHNSQANSQEVFFILCYCLCSSFCNCRMAEQGVLMRLAGYEHSYMYTYSPVFFLSPLNCLSH
jgi:hypothetical protein